MTQQLEQTLLKLLVPDNSIIVQATQELKQMVKDPAVVPVLCELLVVSQRPEVRQYAAVLLRRKILKKKQWNSLQPEICQNIRQNLLQVMIQEPEKSVRKSLAQLVATIAKHDLPESKWPELFSFLEQFIRSVNADQREVGMFVLSSVASSAYVQLKPHVLTLIGLCAATLDEQQNHMVPYYGIQTLMHILPSVGSDQEKAYQNLLPKIVAYIKNLISIDQDLAIESLEIMDDLIECEVPILAPHVKAVMQFFIEVAKNKELESALRVKALSLISDVIAKKKKAIIKLNLTSPLVAEIFPILCEACAEEVKDEAEDEESDEHTASTQAGQVLDVMALHLPPEKYIPPLLKHVEPAFNSPEPRIRRAAYLAIAVSTEGCSENIKNKHMQKLLRSVYKGMTDANAEVRNAALFALGEFSEYLQPDISQFSQELLPLLFECLSKSSDASQIRRKDIVRTYYAMEKFCENLGKDILPYLDQLMQFLLHAVEHGQTFEIKELAISAIGATANAANESLLPYMPKIIELLKGFLSPTEEEGPLKVQTQAIDTLGVLAHALGEDFRGLASECVLLGLALINDAADPDLRRSVFGLFGACSTILKQDLGGHLQTIVTMMLDSLKSTEGVTAHFDDEDTEHVSEIFEDDSSADDSIDVTETGLAGLDKSEDDANDHIKSIDLQNSYMDEKVVACDALGELAMNTGVAFIPFMEECYKEAFNLLEYPDSDIRRTSASCVGQLCSAVGKLVAESAELEATMKPGLISMLNATMTKLIELVREDEDREVALSVLESINEMLKSVGVLALRSIESPNVFLNLVRDVLQRKMKCQDGEEDELDDDEAEYDSMLIVNAGDLLPTLAKLIGGADFAPFFLGMLPELMKKLRKNSTVNDKSFAIGTIAETLEELGSVTSQFVAKLYPVLMSHVRDEDEEVRNNAVYGLGVMSAHGGAAIIGHYGEILKVLSDALAKETDRRVLDNICGAVCRMITTSVDTVPISQVLPVVVNCLPLKEDLEEHVTVFQCLSMLYARRNPDLLNLLPQLLTIIGGLLNTKLKPDVKTILDQLVLDVRQNFPDLIQSVLAASTPEVVNGLQSSVVQNGFS